MIIKIEIDTDKYDVNLIDKKTKTVWTLQPEPEMDGSVIVPGGYMEKPKRLLCERCQKHTSQHETSTGHLCCECYVKEGNSPAEWHKNCMKTYNEIKKEENLNALLQFIKSPAMGGMIHAYPNCDLSQQTTHEALIELEKRGLLERKIDDPNHVLFIVKK